MADNPHDDPQDGELLLDDPLPDDEQPDGQGNQPDDDGGDAHEPETIGFDDDGDAQPQAENDLVRHLRKEIRDRDRRLAESRSAPQQETEIVVGEKPTLEGCEWDADRFALETDAYYDRKERKQAQDQRRNEAQTQQQQAWQKVTDRYNADKGALTYADRDVREATAKDALSEVQVAVIAKVAEKPARLMYALGGSPGKLGELAKIEDPLELAAAVARMEAKVTTRAGGKRPPEPDTQVRGKPVQGASGAAKHLEKLEAEADRTGDRSKVIAFKRAQKAKESK